MSLVCSWNELGMSYVQVSSSPFCTRPFWRIPRFVPPRKHDSKMTPPKVIRDVPTLEDRNLLKLRSIDSSCLFFQSDMNSKFSKCYDRSVKLASGTPNAVIAKGKTERKLQMRLLGVRVLIPPSARCDAPHANSAPLCLPQALKENRAWLASSRE